MKCKLCNRESLRNEEHCLQHYKSTREAEFTDITTGGFFKWVEFFLKEYMPQKSADMHREIVALYFSLYNPFYVNRYNRQLEEVAYRGSAKSTILNFFIPLYLMCHNNQTIKIFAEVPDGETTIIKKVDVVLKERFGVIASKTGSLAEEFVVRMRDELTSNRRLKMFYGSEIGDAVDAIDGQWTRKAFKFNGCTILGVGSGQMIRGRVKGAYRPTFIIFDDIYDESNITDTQRATIKKWFYAGAMNSLDDLNGKALLAGTILHEDTVLVECMSASMWKSVKFYPMPIERFKDLLKHLNINESNRICQLPFEDESNEIIRTTKQIEYFKDLQAKEDWKLAWAERNNLYYMAVKFKDAVETSSTSLFYQEYFHITVSEGMKKFKPDFFQKIKGQWRVFTEFGYNWFECKELYDEPQIINIEFGCDLAGVTSEADNAVIQPVGALPDKRLIVFPSVYGKMSTRDVLRNDSASLFRYEKVVLDRQYIEKMGFLDELFRQYLEYNPSQIKIGIAGEENKTPDDVRLLFQANNVYCQVNPRPQNRTQGSKYERIRFTSLKYYETLSVYHCKGTQLLELELEHLTKYPTDDVADACFTEGTQILTSFGNKDIKKIKTGDFVYTPIGFRKVVATSKRKAEVINKFGFEVTSNHKFYNNNSFVSIDTLEVATYFSTTTIKELLLWKYKMLKYQTQQDNHLLFSSKESLSGEEARANIIFLHEVTIIGSMLKDFISTFGNILMDKNFLKAIMFTTKTITHSITTLTIWSLWKLKSICDTTISLMLQKVKLGWMSILKKCERKRLNGIKAMKVEGGIKGIIEKIGISFMSSMIICDSVWNVVKNLVLKDQMQNIVLLSADTRGEKQQSFVKFAVKNERLGKIELGQTNQLELADTLVEQSLNGLRKKIVYNIQVEGAGCYYANGVLVSNCEVAFFNIQFPAGVSYKQFTEPEILQHRGFKSRKWKVNQSEFDWRCN